MYYADMSEYRLTINGEGPSFLAIGWLDEAYPFTTGPTPVEFQERLLEHCIRGVHMPMLGFHTCQFCEPQGFTSDGHRIITKTWANYKGKRFYIDNGEIWIPDGNSTYSAPVMIYHYVTVHHYRPPEVFINAVLRCPLPYEEEYLAFVRSFKEPFNREPLDHYIDSETNNYSELYRSDTIVFFPLNSNIRGMHRRRRDEA